ncbi:16S rRNA (cytosine(1402)-N(4))-methyltransferase RsmH [Geminicoccaceae bacterium SYSU G07066]|uniref:Ribosomal RNA small subunit methyltransferase H n=1 Tax=Benzoatithermus flavus TaxID=3108223 RepID=A0ABU8XN28_9PROT
MAHRPVLLDEVLETLQPRDGGLYVDATFGGGGYSRAILAAASCRVIGIDRDPDAVVRGEALAAECPRFAIVHAPFGTMREHLAALGVSEVDGVVFDLGVSSFQLDEGGRGFSFQADGPLDMRMEKSGPTADDILGEIDERELARVLFTYGDEPQARAVARAIVAARRQGPIGTTGALAAIVARVKGGRHGPRDPATRTFQALRMLVNDELGELERGLAAAETLIRPGGRLVVVSFHSGEDTTVKRFVNGHGGRQAQPSRHLPPVALPPPRWRWVRHGIVKPGAAEVAANPRSRSARLRVAERLAGTDERVHDRRRGEKETPEWRPAA